MTNGNGGDGPHLGIVSIGADDPENLANFYRDAFGDELWGRNLTKYDVSFSTWIAAGVKLSIGSRHHPDDRVMFHIIVDSLEETAAAVERAGGSMTAGPMDIPVAEDALDAFSDNYGKYVKGGDKADVTPSMGQVAIFDDPEGNPFGAMQLEPWATKLFKGSVVGEFEIGESKVGRKSSDAFHAANPA